MGVAARFGLDKLWREFLPLAQADVLTASLILNLTALALPVVILQVYDRIIPYGATDTLSLLVGGLLAALLLDALLRAARSYLAGWAGARFEHAAGVAAVERILNTNLGRIEAVPAGVHLDRLASVDPVRDFYASQASLVLVDLPFALLFLGFLATIAGSLVLVPLALMLGFGVAALAIGNHLHRALDARAVLDDRRFNFMIEVLGGIRTVKGLAMERLMMRRYDRLMESSAAAGYRVGYLNHLAQSIGTAFSQITMVAVAAIGSLYVMGGQITVGALAACTLLAGRMVQPVLRALGIWSRFQSIRIAETRLSEVEALPAEAVAGKPAAPAIESLALERATVAFDDAPAPLFTDLSLALRRGRITAIEGRNGAGKSTLLWALMGGIAPKAGRLLVNGTPLADWDLASVRGQIAYLPQWPTLFQGSLLDNLTAFGGEAFEEEALRLAALLGLDAIVRRFPGGYETELGTGTASLVAAGVAQRIAIIRALVRRPRVILFDEANTALDPAADERLKQLLLAAREDLAIALISHRPSLLAIGDQRLLLADGTLRPKPSADDAGERSRA
ncbi:MAG: ABC transporter transmembrane domain-containing protein [Sphingomonadales bacterium]